MPNVNQAWERLVKLPKTRDTLACIVTPKGAVVTMGQSQYKTHPLQARFASHPDRIYLHAEIDAIAKALRWITPETLSKCELHIARAKEYRNIESRWRGPGLAKPCTGCARAIAAFGIKKVIWTENVV
jgi:tRNA(Arg) A34 adenosine deaminase TadA